MYKQKPYLLAFTIIILSVSSPLIFANDWATGPIYNNGYENYKFAPNLKGIPKKELVSKTQVISEKGHFAIIDEPVLQAQSSLQSNGQNAQDCGHCQVLWNERTKQYVLLRPSIIIGINPKNNTDEITEVLDQISDIKYSLYKQFIRIDIINMPKWIEIMDKLNTIKSKVRFILPDMLENVNKAQ